jgi:hypothetical protein
MVQEKEKEFKKERKDRKKKRRSSQNWSIFSEK